MKVKYQEQVYNVIDTAADARGNELYLIQNPTDCRWVPVKDLEVL
jgi:hypothetical protein